MTAQHTLQLPKARLATAGLMLLAASFVVLKSGTGTTFEAATAKSGSLSPTFSDFLSDFLRLSMKLLA